MHAFHMEVIRQLFLQAPCTPVFGHNMDYRHYCIKFSTVTAVAGPFWRGRHRQAERRNTGPLALSKIFVFEACRGSHLDGCRGEGTLLRRREARRWQALNQRHPA